MRKLEARKAKRISDYTPFRWKLYLSLVEFMRSVKINTKTITFVKDTSGVSRSTLYKGTFGPFGMVKIKTENQVYTIWHTPAGIRCAYFTSQLEESGEMIGRKTNYTREDIERDYS